MRRKIYDKLLEWKKNHKGDTALLIEYRPFDRRSQTYREKLYRGRVRVQGICVLHFSGLQQGKSAGDGVFQPLSG